MPEVSLAGFKSLEPEPVVARPRVLLDISPALQCGQDAKDVVLVKVEQLGELGHSQLRLLGPECFQHVKGVIHGVDDIITLLPLYHRYLKKAALEPLPLFLNSGTPLQEGGQTRGASPFPSLGTFWFSILRADRFSGLR